MYFKDVCMKTTAYRKQNKLCNLYFQQEFDGIINCVCTCVCVFAASVTFTHLNFGLASSSVEEENKD